MQLAALEFMETLKVTQIQKLKENPEKEKKSGGSPMSEMVQIKHLYLDV